MSDSIDEIESQRIRYRAAMHAMQTGVAYVMEKDGSSTTPKHLRVGVNSALIDSAALATLLIAKGVFTKLEYYTALADAAEREVADYTKRVQELYGHGNVKITLG